MPVINGVYLKDFTALPGAVADADIIPIAITGNQIAYRTTVAGIVTDARITAKLLTGLSVTGGAVVAADTILAAFGKVQNQINGKQGTVTLTTTGTSGAATLVNDTLNIPNYGSALTGYVPYTGATQDVDLGAFKLNAQSFHVKGTAGNGHLGLKHQSSAATASANESSLFADSNGDMSFQNANLYLNKFVTSANSANRTYTFPDATGTVALVGGSGVGTVTSVAALTLGTTGSDLSSTVANGTTTPVITLQVPTASAANRGALSSADWSTFNGKAAALSGTINTIAYWDSATTIASLALATYPSLTELSYVKGVTSAIQTQLNAKQATITLTTTGTSGVATLVGSTLNVPNYADGGVLSLSAIGGTANANAATISGTVLNLQPASASFGGVVTTGTQTFAGSKTFNNDIYVIGGAQVYGLSAIGEYDGGAQIPPAYGGNYALTLGSGLTANGLSLYATGAALLTSTATATAFIPSGATVPTNGMYLSAANTLNFATNTTNRLSIASTGAATFSSSVTITGSTAVGLIINSADVPFVKFNVSNGSQKNWGVASTNLAVGDFGIYQSTSIGGNPLIGTAALYFNSSLAATFSSGISVGAATATTGGIQFPATAVAIADANNLDDYEEGTWTATLTCGTSGTITLSNSGCIYTKIGRLVNISGYIVVGSVSSPVGRLTLGGFPFTQISDGVPVGLVYMTTTNAFTGIPVLLGNGASGATIDRNAGTGADPATDMSSAIKANSEIYFNITYTS